MRDDTLPAISDAFLDSITGGQSQTQLPWWGAPKPVPSNPAATNVANPAPGQIGQALGAGGGGKQCVGPNAALKQPSNCPQIVY